MANEKVFSTHATNNIVPTIGDADIALVGAGIDTNTAGPLTIGGTNATSIVLGAPVTFDSAQTGSIQWRTLTIGHADLVDADGSQAFNLDAVLPAKAQIVGVSVDLTTPFTGGGAAAVTLDIGTAGDPDAIVANGNLFAAAVDGQASSLPAGVAPNKRFAAAGAQLLATVDADVNVADLTAGAATIWVMFVAQP